MQNAIAWRWSEDPEQKRWMDWKTDWTHHDKAKAMGFQVEYAVAQSALNEPGKVYHAMLRGEIPKLTWRQMVHLSGPVPNTADEALAEITRLRGEVKGLEADIDRYLGINAELATELEESRRVLEEARRVSRELHGADRCTKCGYLFLESEHIGCIRRESLVSSPSPDCTEVLTRPLQQESGKVVLDGEVLSVFDVFGGHHGKWLMTVAASLDMDAQGVLTVLKRVGYNVSSALKKHVSTLDLPERTEQERKLQRDMLDIADTLQKAVAPLRDDSHLRRFPTCFDAIDRCIYRLKEGGK